MPGMRGNREKSFGNSEGQGIKLFVEGQGKSGNFAPTEVNQVSAQTSNLKPDVCQDFYLAALGILCAVIREIRPLEEGSFFF